MAKPWQSLSATQRQVKAWDASPRKSIVHINLGLRLTRAAHLHLPGATSFHRIRGFRTECRNRSCGDIYCTSCCFRAKKLITVAGLSRKVADATSAARPIGNEHDEDEMEEIEPSDRDRSSKPVCSRCAGEMEGNREDWFSALTTRFMLKAVAAILVTIGRSGQSLLVQIQRALASPDFKARWIFSPYQIQLIESMLVECLEDPRPLMRAVLGKDHPRIREAEKNAARPPPDSEDEVANA